MERKQAKATLEFKDRDLVIEIYEDDVELDKFDQITSD